MTWWELFRKYAPVVSGPSVAPSYTTRKAKQMETASTYFFEKPPLTNRDISGWFSDWSAGIFQNSFHISQPTQPGTPGMKRGRHCEKYRPGFGTFCPKGIKSAPCLKMRNLYNFTNGKQCKCGHTCYFWLAGGRQKCLLGSLPKPGSLGQNVPKRLVASPPLSRLFLMNKIATL